MAGASKSTDRLVNIFVCIGAAVVIFGAWAKILHLPIADTMLTVGLLTEAAIFIIYALLPPPGGGMSAQVQVLTKNLSSLNTIYELELQDTNNHLKAMNSFYSNLVQASETMQGSVTDAKKTQEQIALLAKNLGNLNHIYGNMLSAMQGRA